MSLRRHFSCAAGLAAVLVALLPPVMAVAAGATGPSTARAWLDAVEARLVEADGRALRLLSGPGRADASGTGGGPVIVFHAPLSTMWVLDADSVAEAGDAEVVATAALLREDTEEGGRLLVAWRNGAVDEAGWPQPLPEFEVARERHPLAVMHDALLSAPLARHTAGIPAGWRFRPDGLVLPGDPEAEVRTATLWRSVGHWIAVEHADGFVILIALDDLADAIRNEPAEPAVDEGEGAE